MSRDKIYIPLHYKGYIVDADDPEIEEALGYLLAETVLITGFFSPPNPQLQFGVLCNDTFYRAADMELLTDSSEIFDVFHIYRKDGYDGLVEWIAKRRGIRPLKERNNTLQTHDPSDPDTSTPDKLVTIKQKYE